MQNFLTVSARQLGGLSIQVLLFLSFAGVIQGITLPAKIDAVKMDKEIVVSGPHYPFVPRSTIIVADSSGGEFSMWTQLHECLAYNPTDEYLEFVCRNFTVSGNIDVWQNDKTFSTPWSDVNVYTQELGPARYPNSIASINGSGPHISMPTLVPGPSWGQMVGQYEYGGWFSSFWDSPVDVGIGDLDVHKCIGKQLPDSNILFIGVAANSYRAWLTWSTYTSDLSTRLAGGIVAPETTFYWGFDINGGIAYLFYYDNNFNIYYKTTADGIDWSPAQIYNMVWPEPYDSNIVYWKQMAVTETRNPILVFDNINGADNEYPYEGKVYVSIASGQPCIEVGITTAGVENFYPTISTGGNYVVVLFGKPRSGTGQYTFWDIYYNYSMDNGLTWHTPISLTTNITDHNNCLWQIAKRLDTEGYGQLFFTFGCSIFDPILDLYWNIQNGPPTACRWYVGRNDVVGITEQKGVQCPDKSNLLIMPNPTRKSALIKFNLIKDGYVQIDMYDLTGRILKNLTADNYTSGNHTLKFDLKSDDGISDGVYFIKMKTDGYQAVEKLIVRRLYRP